LEAIFALLLAVMAANEVLKMLAARSLGVPLGL
jgi:hypothetical protein